MRPSYVTLHAMRLGRQSCDLKHSSNACQTSALPVPLLRVDDPVLYRGRPY